MREQLQSEFAFEARVTVAQPLSIGDASRGLRRIIPITGGSVAGPRLNGRVLAGGADWQVVRADGVLELEARYTLESDNGVRIMITNRALRHGPPEVIERLTRGESVDPALYYFRTVPQFEAPTASAYAWLNRAIFVGVAERQSDAAVVRFFEIK